MNHPRAIASAPPTSSYGFHCVLQPQAFAQAVAPVTVALKTEGFDPELGRRAHEARERLERVRSALERLAC